MALNNPAMVVAANALRAAMTHMQLHSGDPGAAGTANVTSAARQPVTWSAATADGDFGLSASVNFTGVAANGATTYVSLWSAITAGTWYGNFALTGDQTANAAGEYTVTALNLNGSAT
jgi:Zn-dependent oligopeptidase